MNNRPDTSIPLDYKNKPEFIKSPEQYIQIVETFENKCTVDLMQKLISPIYKNDFKAVNQLIKKL